MNTEWLKRNWPYLAAGAAAILAIYLMRQGSGSSSTQGGVVVPAGPSPSQVLAAQTASEQTQARLAEAGIAAKGTAIHDYLAYLEGVAATEAQTTQAESANAAAVQIQKAQSAASVNAAQIYATEAAQVQAERNSAATQQSLFSTIGTAIGVLPQLGLHL